MTVLDAGLLALRGLVREWAPDVRGLGPVLDADPDAIHRHLDLPAVKYLSTLMVPPEYGGEPVVAGGRRFHGTSALERAVVMEELAAADAGVLLAAPGPSMSGVLVDLIGDDEQKKWFYGTFLDGPRWAFFGLTEPAHGSDASALSTTLAGTDPAGGVLNGTKRYVGNATRASVGAVFARTGPGPVGITAALVDTADPGYSATPLPMLGLRGARIGEIALSGVAVPSERVLGRHLSPARRGMWACVQTFNRLRPGVAAIALGIARAAHEYAAAHRPGARDRLDGLRRRIDATRALIHVAAASVDARGDAGHAASAAKARACRLAEDATLLACAHLGPGARLDHPPLDKLCRDARGVEFMEGTENMQKLTLFQGYVTGKLTHSTR